MKHLTEHLSPLVSLTACAIFMLCTSISSALPPLESIELNPLDPETEESVNLAEVKTRYIALHFLSDVTKREDTEYIDEFGERSAEIAALDHFFIRPGDREAADRLARNVEGSGVTLYYDRLGSAAKKFDVSREIRVEGKRVFDPTIVVIEPAVGEILRTDGTYLGDHPTFDEFRAKFMEKTASPALHHHNLGKKRVAAGGYDVVSYQQEDGPKRGRSPLKSTYEAVTYQFATEENRATFNADPEQYIPAYGGWCATAMADGDKVDIKPEHYTVTDGTLYLFASPALGLFGNPKKKWDKDEEKLKTEADAEWGKLTR